MRGRKPKPTWQKKLEGNRGKRALNSSEPVYDAPSDAFDDVPAELADMPGAAAEWSRLVPLLRKARAITEADRSPLLTLCIEYARYHAAIKQAHRTGMVITTPSGQPMVNPYLTIARAAFGACAKLWPELGLTPSSRSRISTDPAGPVDEFTEFDAPPSGVTKPVH